MMEFVMVLPPSHGHQDGRTPTPDITPPVFIREIPAPIIIMKPSLLFILYNVSIYLIYLKVFSNSCLSISIFPLLLMLILMDRRLY